MIVWILSTLSVKIIFLLKYLVYEYKDIKEKEIKVLADNQTNFKDEIEKNKEVYEKIIDDAADKIENFIQKTNLNNQIQ